jgi:hypothetical protein
MRKKKPDMNLSALCVTHCVTPEADLLAEGAFSRAVRKTRLCYKIPLDRNGGGICTFAFRIQNTTP